MNLVLRNEDGTPKMWKNSLKGHSKPESIKNRLKTDLKFQLELHLAYLFCFLGPNAS